MKLYQNNLPNSNVSFIAYGYCIIFYYKYDIFDFVEDLTSNWNIYQMGFCSSEIFVLCEFCMCGESSDETGSNIKICIFKNGIWDLGQHSEITLVLRVQNNEYQKPLKASHINICGFTQFRVSSTNTALTCGFDNKNWF